MMKQHSVLYPGSFDPVTLGHLDIINRASKMFTEVIIGVANNQSKRIKLPTQQRVELLEKVTSHLPNIKIELVDGLIVNYAAKHNIPALLRGLRTPDDFNHELEMSQINHSLSESKDLNQAIETVFLMTSPQYSFIRSSRVWELLALNANIRLLVPEVVANYLEEHTKVGYL
jgi:pantetheine-phosphate adenylyltransferase